MRYAYEDHHAHIADIAGIADRNHWLRGTDVQHVWRKHGWVPPSEIRPDFKRQAAAQQSSDGKPAQ